MVIIKKEMVMYNQNTEEELATEYMNELKNQEYKLVNQCICGDCHIVEFEVKSNTNTHKKIN